MPLFKFTSASHPGEIVEFYGTDVGAALGAASRIRFVEADLSEEEGYVFTFRKEVSPGGGLFWCIFERPN